MASTTAAPPTALAPPTATATATAIHPYKEVLAGSVAAVASTLVCHPIDVLRTELQTQQRATTARACLRRIGASCFCVDAFVFVYRVGGLVVVGKIHACLFVY